MEVPEMDKEVRKLVQSIQHIPGVEIEGTGNSHLIVKYNDRFVTTLPSTPSDSRWRDNTVATLRRHGITPGTKPRGKAANVTGIRLMSREEIQARLLDKGATHGERGRFAK